MIAKSNIIPHSRDLNEHGLPGQTATGAYTKASKSQNFGFASDNYSMRTKDPVAYQPTKSAKTLQSKPNETLK